VTIRIALILEGPTESAFRPILLEFLRQRLSMSVPKLDFLPEGGRIPKGADLKRKVELLLLTNDAVIALTDVYTGTVPPDFNDAADAKAKMRTWVGDEPRFHPHAAQYEFEAWLFPYWPRIRDLSGSNRTAPSADPESVNHNKPPSRHLAEIFRTARKGRAYSKTRDAAAILRGQDLSVACAACTELKALLNTILTLSGGAAL
jgi:hypothetical protein